MMKGLSFSNLIPSHFENILRIIFIIFSDFGFLIKITPKVVNRAIFYNNTWNISNLDFKYFLEKEKRKT